MYFVVKLREYSSCLWNEHGWRSRIVTISFHNYKYYKYLEINDILFKNQYGFRKKHSTSFALIDLYDKISTAIENKETAVGIFLDLSKAFDTVNHEILFRKLEHYGLHDLPLQWVKSYFYERKQVVIYNNESSTPKPIVCGVPQGSILGPLFFFI